MRGNKSQILEIVNRALKEDLGIVGDITSDNIFSEEEKCKGKILAKEPGIICGLEVAEMVFKQCNNNLSFNFLKKDGDIINKGEEIAHIEGVTRDILKGERTALNFLQRLSGIATQTADYVEKIKDYPVRITDTRKTTPTLRILEKYAVTVGGGYNHRMGLYDAVMIKDNHIRAAGGIKTAVKNIREQVPHTTKIEVEVENLKEIKEALKAEADIIMLDNMEYKEMEEACSLIQEKIIIEASGGINLETIQKVAETGVDIISIGALTHQIESLDISMDIVPFKKIGYTRDV